MKFVFGAGLERERKGLLLAIFRSDAVKSFGFLLLVLKSLRWARRY